ncbi:MAG: VCBS repeat-containing protein [Deltaproteobacteria bacterium]|nr:VCBS repeat-containing protein [Deltaproteobacteria bacterium]
MLRRALLVVCAALALGGCLRRATFDNCQQDGDCATASAAGHCEADHACSVDDSACPGSGHRYVPSAPAGAVCVAPPDAAPDTAPGLDATPDAATSTGRECIKGGARAADTPCATTVCTREPRCCTEQWDATCVRIAETECPLACSTMAFVGGNHATVFRTSDWSELWTDTVNQDDDGTRGGYWADYDGDGDEDLATVGNYQLNIYENKGLSGGALTFSHPYSQPWKQIGGNDTIDGRTGAWGDFDGDHDLDLVFGGFGGLVTIENQGGVFAVKQVLLHAPLATDTDAAPYNDQVATVAWGDVDGDGDLDLLVGLEFAAARLYLNDGSGTLAPAAWAGPNGVESIQFCNLDTTPKPEVVISGADGLSVFELTGSTIEDKTQATAVATNVWLVETRCGDLDHDHDLDLFSTTWGAAPRAYRNTNQTLAGLTQAWIDTGAQPYQWGVDLGDLDGDHKLEAIASGNGFGPPMKIQVYRNGSTNQNQSIEFTVEAPIGGANMITSNDIELGSLPTP